MMSTAQRTWKAVAVLVALAAWPVDASAQAPTRRPALNSASPFQRPKAAAGASRGSTLESLWNRQNSAESRRNIDPDHAPAPPGSHRRRRPNAYVQPIIQPNLGPAVQPQPATRSRASLQIINREPSSSPNELPPQPAVDENPLLDVQPAPASNELSSRASQESPALEARPRIGSPTPSTAAVIKDGAQVLDNLDRQLRSQSESEQRHLDNIRNQLKQLDLVLSQRLQAGAIPSEPPKQPKEQAPVGPAPSATESGPSAPAGDSEGASDAPPPSPPPSSPLDPPLDPPLPTPPMVNPLAPPSSPQASPQAPSEPATDSTSSLPPAINMATPHPEMQEPAEIVEMSSQQPNQTPPPPTGDVVTSGVVDRLGLADSFYASGQLAYALQAYKELAPTLQGEDRVWVDYQTANALRRLKQPKEAESKYREVAAEAAPNWVVESARWWLKLLDKQNTIQQGVAQIEAQLDAAEG